MHPFYVICKYIMYVNNLGTHRGQTFTVESVLNVGNLKLPCILS